MGAPLLGLPKSIYYIFYIYVRYLSARVRVWFDIASISYHMDTSENITPVIKIFQETCDYLVKAHLHKVKSTLELSTHQAEAYPGFRSMERLLRTPW